MYWKVPSMLEGMLPVRICRRTYTWGKVSQFSDHIEMAEGGGSAPTLTRSSGWVTQAAMLLADPPNQKGYRIEGACFCSLLARTGFFGTEAGTSFSDRMVQSTELVL